MVLQSHRQPLPQAWLEPCLHSVQNCAALNGFDYSFVDDQLFDAVADDILTKTNRQKVITSDLVRIIKLKSLLQQDYDCVIWCDADFLIFNADKFALPESSYALGREVWVQQDRQNRLRAYSKVHNAFTVFLLGNSFLDFYTDTAEKLLLKNNGTMPPQFIAPKLLIALHNIALCPVQENAGMLSPLVIQDLIKGGGEVPDFFIKKSPQPICAENLYSSSIEKGELSDWNMNSVIQNLLNFSGDIFYSI